MPSNGAPSRVGVDIGGTFTDIVLAKDGKLFAAKILTTPEDPSVAVLQALDGILRRSSSESSSVGSIVHATTLVANAITERKGARTALLTTCGARDALEIGDSRRYDRYDLFIRRPSPLVPRYLRLEVNERLNADGSVDIPIDEQQVADLCDALRNSDIEAVAVCLIHSYVNRQHEDELAHIIRKELPDVEISLSSHVDPNIGEYLRSSTAACDAYVKPIVRRYLVKLDEGLRERSPGTRFYVMLSNGGIADWTSGAQMPIRLLESGPAAGAVASAYRGKASGLQDLVSLDMGGTTAKICLIRNGEPAKTDVFEVAREDRFKKGSGLPVRIPSVELLEIGAGGGSIATLDSTGLLKVGPQSAGADPGPACYGMGGNQPTVTDADVVLGLIGTTSFLGGEMPLNPRAAEQVIESKIATQLGLSVVSASAGIYEVVNTNMAVAARLHLTERGVDPRNVTLIAFGGAGPVHAYEIARQLKIGRVIVPPGAGVESAFGLLAAIPEAEFTRTLRSALHSLQLEKLLSGLRSLAKEGMDVLANAGVEHSDMTVKYGVDVRFKGQAGEVTVWHSEEDIRSLNAEIIKNRFLSEYRRLHSIVPPPEKMSYETVTIRARVSAETPKQVRFSESAFVEGNPLMSNDKLRPVYFPEMREFVETKVVPRSSLSSGIKLAGPLIVEERESTTVVGPSAELSVDKSGNINFTMDK